MQGRTSTSFILFNGEDEKFTWDGLALLRRDNTNYLNEPYATGGNPVLAGKKVLFNDMLGTTQGSISKNGKYQATNRTAFGAGDKSGFFTGKPHVKGLGSVFLYRNYRPNQAKWTSSDPLGYPDGWNNLAYVNNMVTRYIDYLGGEFIEYITYSILWALDKTISYVSEKFCDWDLCLGHDCNTTDTDSYTKTESITVLYGTSVATAIASSNIDEDSFTTSSTYTYDFTYMTCE